MLNSGIGFALRYKCLRAKGKMKMKITEINNMLKLDPDRILINGVRDIKHLKFSADTLLEISATVCISLIKHTLNGYVLMQIEKGKIYTHDIDFD